MSSINSGRVVLGGLLAAWAWACPGDIYCVARRRGVGYTRNWAKSEIPAEVREEHEMNRRRWLKTAGGSVAAGAIGMLGEKNEALAQTYSKATRGLPALKITNVKTIQTCPEGGNYVVVKVETSEPGLYWNAERRAMRQFVP
jgi:hypothetical protein